MMGEALGAGPVPPFAGWAGLVASLAMAAIDFISIKRNGHALSHCTYTVYTQMEHKSSPLMIFADMKKALERVRLKGGGWGWDGHSTCIKAGTDNSGFCVLCGLSNQDG